MVYIALLRGINVGGNHKVEMPRLKLLFENLSFTDVRTYINSGNIIFSSSQKNQVKLSQQIEEAIEGEFGFPVPTIVKSAKELKSIADVIPANWQNNSSVKCDVLFLWPELDSSKTLDLLSLNPKIEEFKYIPGAIIWHIDRDNYGKSKFPKIIGTPTYKQMTIRNCNTVRKLISLL